MNNLLNLSGYAIGGSAAQLDQRQAGVRLAAVATLLLATLGIMPSGTYAQRPEIKVTSVSAQGGANGTNISIAADAALGKAQTWQDNEGYHVVIPNSQASPSLRSTKGIKIRRVGTSLEVLIQTKPGARVNVLSADNKLNLAVEGKLENRTLDYNSPAVAAAREEARVYQEQQNLNSGNVSGSPTQPLPTSQDLSPASSSRETAQNSTNWNPAMGPQPAAPSQPRTANSEVSDPAATGQVEIHPEADGMTATIFSGSGLLILLALGLFGLFVSRRLHSRPVAELADVEAEDDELFETSEITESRTGSAGTGPIRGGQPALGIGPNGATGLTRQPSSPMKVASPTSLFGAYRIDQEVGKLVLGQAHRLDVLSSRAIDDRRAIEASLIKSVNSPDLDEDGRRKAREALEEYGFVARQCAALLLAPDAFERTSAARALGETRSPAALPFLLEALYDAESIVRNQAVVSIGELKLPAAIGALLDIARTHPDVPSALLSRTLSACSVEGLDFFDAVMPDPGLLVSGDDIVEKITQLEPVTSVEDLPPTSDDERLTQALTMVESGDVQERAEGLKALAQFRVQSSVDAMAIVARKDSQPNLRSAAISNLGAVNHQSVFPSILIGMADEAREVRAAAARSLNRLSFDRAEAYVRLLETGNDAALVTVAKACVKAGIVSQNLDRLSTSDHRQAYETFSLISMLAKARLTQPVLDAIASHPNSDVRIKAVHLLACTNQPEVYDQLRELSVRDGMREDVRTALLEALYKIEQGPQPAEPQQPAIDEDPYVEVIDSGDPADTIYDTDTQPVIGLEPEVESDLHLHFQFEPTGEAEVKTKPGELEL